MSTRTLCLLIFAILLLLVKLTLQSETVTLGSISIQPRRATRGVVLQMAAKGAATCPTAIRCQ